VFVMPDSKRPAPKTPPQRRATRRRIISKHRCGSAGAWSG
jgi:hypothetical protein